MDPLKFYPSPPSFVHIKRKKSVAPPFPTLMKEVENKKIAHFPSLLSLDFPPLG